MIEFIPYLILIIVTLLFIIYATTKNYDSFKGILLLILGFSALFLKIFFVHIQTKFSVESTFLISGLITGGFTLFGVVILLFIRKYKKYNLKYFFTLLILYILFGFIQQLFFQFVILETLFYLINSYVPTILLSALFYGLFHKRNLLFFITTFAAGLIWSTTYLYFGNLIWLGISHGVLATFAYTGFVKKDMIKDKLHFLNI